MRNNIKHFLRTYWLTILLSTGLLTISIMLVKQRNTIKELTEELSDAEDKIYDIHNEVNKLESSISELRSCVENFNYDNWRDVVPEVEDATRNIESEFEELKSSTE